MDSFRSYILANHKYHIVKILECSDNFNGYSINVDFIKLFEADPILGDGILCNPKYILPKCSNIIIEIQKKIYDEEFSSGGYSQYNLKSNIHARFFGLPVCPELHRITVPKNNDLGCFLKISGTAIRLTQSKMLEYRKNYKCSRCQHIELVEGKYEHRYVIKPPYKCSNPDIQCRSNNMIPVHDVIRNNCRDYQELKIQEQVNKLTVGGIPGSIWVTLEDDLVDCCKPGDDVSICGIVMRRWHPIFANKTSEVELVFRANHIEVCNAQKSLAVSIAPDVHTDFADFWSIYEKSPMKGRDIILASVCPKVFGLYMVKLALTLTVITGCSYNHDSDKEIKENKILKADGYERNVRGQCHLLLVGDPGTGKSQLLKAAAMLTSRSVLTSGSGSTKAGLTCTALREDGEWQLEAGALVLADGGACCIDELAQMREHDRASIHEAMEQQTISVAKAGIICKLNTRCSVIAACNPKGNYDTEQPLSVNVSLGTPLLSRFDLIFILLDTQTLAWDKRITDYILFGNAIDTPCVKSWPIEKLQLYLSLIGPYEVSMTRASTEILQSYYVMQRKAENRDPSRTTVRMLDSLVRLSQAHARLMNRHKVYTMDAVTAVTLMDLSMQDCILTGSSDALQSTFQQYPDFHYLKSAKRLLSNLNLYEIWQSELLFFSRLLNVDTKQLESDIDNDIFDIFIKFDKLDHTSDDLYNDNIVESTYFKKNENMDNCKEAENNIEILSKNNTTVIDNSSNTIHNKDYIKPNNIDNGFEDKKCNLSDKYESKPSNLLAKSIQKQSMINSNTNKIYTGIITGKQKKTTKKPSNVMNNLNGLKTVSKRKRVIKNNVSNKKIKKTHTKTVGNNSSIKSTEDSESSSDECVDEIQMLNCLPSVNDPFHGLNISFNISDDDSNNAQNDLERSTANETSLLDSNKSIDQSSSNESLIVDNDAQLSKNIKKVSPVNVNTMNKLKKFMFTSGDKKSNNDTDNNMSCSKTKNVIKNEIKSKELHNTLPSIAASKNMPNVPVNSNIVVVQTIPNSDLDENMRTSQRSIFENSDDNFSDLDI